jgi:hypothetical protein
MGCIGTILPIVIGAYGWFFIRAALHDEKSDLDVKALLSFMAFL